MKLGPLREAFADEIDDVEDALVDYLSATGEPAAHRGMVLYHLGFANESLHRLDKSDRLPRGKRLRAVFSMLIARALSASEPASRVLMTAAEMMHAASLVHDDIQDAERTRWGRATIWARFGTGQAINVGDARIGMVYDLLLNLRKVGVEERVVLRVLEIFNRAHLRMAEGQHLDLSFQGAADVSVDQYLQMITLKTAAACECIAHSSAVLADRGIELEELYRKFGVSYGLLYQICDDVRGIWSEAAETGKEPMWDLVLEKRTLPVLYGLQHDGSDRLRTLLRAAESGASDRDRAFALRAELDQLDARPRCKIIAKKCADEAIGYLRATKLETPEHQMLEMMTILTAQAAGVTVS